MEQELFVVGGHFEGQWIKVDRYLHFVTLVEMPKIPVEATLQASKDDALKCYHHKYRVVTLHTKYNDINFLLHEHLYQIVNLDVLAKLYTTVREFYGESK